MPIRDRSRKELLKSRVPAVALLLGLFALTLLIGAGSPSSGDPTTTTLRTAAAVRRVFIGAAVHTRFLDEPAFTQILTAEFSQLEPENEMKFALIHPRPDTDPHPYDFTGADTLVSFALLHDMKVRGHTLLWHRQVPTWITKGTYKPSQLAEILHGHVNTVLSRYASKVYAWDVVNEAFNDDGTMRHTVWYDQPGIGFAGQGTGYVEQAFRWARAADPNAKLFYNDYDAEPVNPKSDAIYAMAVDFKRRGVPLDGVGIQAHVDLSFDNPSVLASFRKNMKRFADLGLEIHITELDVRLHDGSTASLNAQAKIYGEIASACLDLSACKVIQTWGVSDNHSWIPSEYPDLGWSLLWDANYQKKPAYAAMLDALMRPR